MAYATKIVHKLAIYSAVNYATPRARNKINFTHICLFFFCYSRWQAGEPSRSRNAHENVTKGEKNRKASDKESACVMGCAVSRADGNLQWPQHN